MLPAAPPPLHSRPAKGRPRPALFRALGNDEPPEVVVVDGHEYRRAETFKHDSWAATALYESTSTRTDRTQRIVCKFNRRQSVFGVPTTWLGRRLARREAAVLHRLADEPHVPAPCGPVVVDGRVAPHAVAHEFVPGRPLSHLDRPDESFFREFAHLLDVIHAHGMAYVDLHKCENVLVGDDGRPYLIDFQISVRLPRIGPLGRLLSVLQHSDRYHLAKHVRKLRPDLPERDPATWACSRPWWIRLHRCVAVPFRWTRRSLFVVLGIRTGRGHSHSEYEPEDAVRRMEQVEPGHPRAA